VSTCSTTLYHYKTDPDGLVNLVEEPAYADILAGLRQQLANEMYMTNDFMLGRFEQTYRIRGVEMVIGCTDKSDASFNPRANRHDHKLCSGDHS